MADWMAVAESFSRCVRLLPVVSREKVSDLAREAFERMDPMMVGLAGSVGGFGNSISLDGRDESGIVRSVRLAKDYESLAPRYQRCRADWDTWAAFTTVKPYVSDSVAPPTMGHDAHILRFCAYSCAALSLRFALVRCVLCPTVSTRL